ncbi:MAG: chorismate synthase [Flavobacteriales bacterium]|nr:chorismate synthase [Flavobacteriales bacterium]MCB9447623.1 chorismate synthase [Flavobacteriales bacterium]
MPGNSFGQIFRLTTFGESHGVALGGVIDGCPAGLALDLEAIQQELDRRRPGQSKITTQRKEPDTVEWLSGIFEGKTTGAPIGFIIRNANQRSADYDHIKEVYRPSHADYTYDAKYGHRDYRGGGRSSARETASRVVGGAVARQLLQHQGISIRAWVSSVGEIAMEDPSEVPDHISIESNIVRCPDAAVAEKMITLIDQIRKDGDTVGGVVSAAVTGCPAGFGEPAFHKLHADLGAAMLSINACKGFEYGSGFAGTRLRGSEHNDVFIREGDEIRTQTNHSGGIQGGISNSMPILFKAAFKPVATIMRPQQSVNKEGASVTVEGRGRHDPCVLPRAVPIVEAMAALVLADHVLLHKTARI